MIQHIIEDIIGIVVRLISLCAFMMFLIELAQVMLTIDIKSAGIIFSSNWIYLVSLVAIFFVSNEIARFVCSFTKKRDD